MLSHGDRLCTRLVDMNSHILIILDEIWKAPDLKRLGIPSGRNHKHQCKVIFTILFKQKFGNFIDNPSILDIAKEVDKECKGLPLAIITVAGALKNLKTKPS